MIVKICNLLVFYYILDICRICFWIYLLAIAIFSPALTACLTITVNLALLARSGWLVGARLVVVVTVVVVVVVVVVWWWWYGGGMVVVVWSGYGLESRGMWWCAGWLAVLSKGSSQKQNKKALIWVSFKTGPTPPQNFGTFGALFPKPKLVKLSGNFCVS